LSAIGQTCQLDPFNLSVFQSEIDIGASPGGPSRPPGFSLSGSPGGDVNQLQRCYRRMLFGDTLFEILLFNVAQLGFEQALIPFDVLLMGA
jgi:hypothetical protein